MSIVNRLLKRDPVAVTAAPTSAPAKAPKAAKPRDAASTRFDVEVVGDDARFIYSCGGRKEARRAERMFTKEPGTIQWLRETLQPGDVFWDIGGNIGCYTLYAARRLAGFDPAGQVVAFEPHIPNADSLLQNVTRNGLQATTRLMTVPLSDGERFGAFTYRSEGAGTSGSQFGEARDPDGTAFDPCFTAIVRSTSADLLLEAGAVPSPDVVKVDVDGLELEIITGMQTLLGGDGGPRSLQIEVRPGIAEPLHEMLTGAGYVRASEHLTQSRQRDHEAGTPITELERNAVYVREH